MYTKLKAMALNNIVNWQFLLDENQVQTDAAGENYLIIGSFNAGKKNKSTTSRTREYLIKVSDFTSDIIASIPVQTLTTILANGNATGANDLSIDSGQTLDYNVGSGGSLTSLSTASSRTWSLPDNTGTLALLSDIPVSENLATANITADNVSRIYSLFDTDAATSLVFDNGTDKILELFGDQSVKFFGSIGINGNPLPGSAQTSMTGDGGTYGHFVAGVNSIANFASQNSTTTPTQFLASKVTKVGFTADGDVVGTAERTGFRASFQADNSADNVGFRADVVNGGAGEAIAIDILNGNIKTGTGTTDFIVGGDLITDIVSMVNLSGDKIVDFKGDQTIDFFGVSKVYTFESLSTINTGPLGAKGDLINWDIISGSLFNCLLTNLFNANGQVINNAQKLTIGGSSLGDGNNFISFANGTPPTVLGANIYKQYSKDVAVGNAAPHWMTENLDEFNLHSIGGWGDPTGSLTRTTFDTTTVTTEQLAERVAGMIDDFRNQYNIFKA